jgi:hypothetical protein
MSKRVLIVNGHPDNAPERFCSALARPTPQGRRRAGT